MLKHSTHATGTCLVIFRQFLVQPRYDFDGISLLPRGGLTEVLKDIGLEKAGRSDLVVCQGCLKEFNAMLYFLVEHTYVFSF